VGYRESLLDGLERRTVEPPPLGLVDVALVVERKAGFLQRLEVAANRPGRDAGQLRQFMNRDPGTARLDLPQDLPLANDLGIARHGEAIVTAVRRTKAAAPSSMETRMLAGYLTSPVTGAPYSRAREAHMVTNHFDGTSARQLDLIDIEAERPAPVARRAPAPA